MRSLHTICFIGILCSTLFKVEASARTTGVTGPHAADTSGSIINITRHSLSSSDKGLSGDASPSSLGLNVSSNTDSSTVDATYAANNQIPAISAMSVASNASAQQLATSSPPNTLQDMLCAVKSYSPTGLQGMALPALSGQHNSSTNNNNYSTSSCSKPGSSNQLQCPTNKPLINFNYKQLAFKPIRVPVVFHCLRFWEGAKLQPNYKEHEQAARNMLDVVNKLYQRTGIQFYVQQVRQDPAKHPYLLMASLRDWQACTANSKSYPRFLCLLETAEFSEVAALSAKHIINVFVAGSQHPAAGLCRPGQPTTCTPGALYSGYTQAAGPWDGTAATSTRVGAGPATTGSQFSLRAAVPWREGSSAHNWVFISYDVFSPVVKNSPGTWNAGGNTLAHEFGHYFGLAHTHEGTPCEGDGLYKGDAVPDTPVNLQVDVYAAQQQILDDLDAWCQAFRSGKRPCTELLQQFDTCNQGGGRVANLFNVMSYTPDSCIMVFSPNQIARMQWVVAAYRPKMMQTYSVGR